jgi:hypothetical protein
MRVIGAAGERERLCESHPRLRGVSAFRRAKEHFLIEG